MNFQKFVHRSTKGIMLFIALMMIIPLVLWGYMGKAGNERDEKEAGKIFETVSVSEGQFLDQKRKAFPTYYWRMVRRNPQAVFMMLQGRRMPEPPAAELAKLARQNIVLLQDAKDKGIPAATPADSRRKFQEIWQAITFGRFPATPENLQAIAANIFHASPAVFESWVDDLVVIDKLLGMMSGSEFAEYEKVYDRVMGEQQSVKVSFAAFDPLAYAREVKPPRTEEIAKYYEANKAKYKTAEKVRIEYLLADYDEIKKKAPEPTPDEVKKYYEDHKSEFQKPAPEHKHGPGEEHKDDEKPPAPEFKTFEEVQADIPDRIRRKWAEDKAVPVMGAVHTALGEAFIANKDKYPDTIFDDLKKKYAIEAGLELTHDVTSLFDRKHVDEIEKTIGSGSGMESWAFDPKQKEGDISNKLGTTKGLIFLKLAARKAPEENPGVTAQNREAIVKELQKEQIKKRAQQQAGAVIEEIKARGIAEARLKFPVEWRSTRYFRTDFNGDPGVEDRALGNALRMQAARAKIGEALLLQGSMVSREKADWAYVVYVDDSVAMPPDNLEAKFQESRRELDGDARERFQESYINTIVFRANVKGLDSNATPGGPSVPAPIDDDDH